MTIPNIDSEVYTLTEGAEYEDEFYTFSGFEIYENDNPEIELYNVYYIEKEDLKNYTFGEHTKIIYIPKDCKKIGWNRNCLCIYEGTLEEAKENDIARYMRQGVYGTRCALVCNCDSVPEINRKATQAESYSSASRLTVGNRNVGAIAKFSSDAFNYESNQISLEQGTLTEAEKARVKAFVGDKEYTAIDIHTAINGYKINPQKPVTLMFEARSFRCEMNQLTVYHLPENGEDEVFTAGNGLYSQTVDGTEYWCIDVESLSPFAFCIDVGEDDYPDIEVEIRNFDKYNGKTLDYKSSVTFRFFATIYDINIDASELTFEWNVIGAEYTKNNDKSITVIKATGNFTVEMVIKDKDGNVIATSEKETINIKHGFLDKLIAFFKGLFGLLPEYEQ